jgi:hypothetical protein
VASGDQLHDFNPGINPFPNGLFWFVDLSPSSFHVNLNAGTAQLSVHNLAIEDYTNLTNALTSDPPHIPEIASTVSFDVHWSGVLARVHRNNPTEGFAGSFVETNATIIWSARQTQSPFFSFVTDPPKVSPQTTVFAEIGHEGNGIFYRPG